MRKSERVSDLMLEKMRLNELSSEQMNRLGDLSADVQNRLARLAREDEAFLNAHPASIYVPKILQRAEASRRRVVWPQFAAVAALLLIAPASFVLMKSGAEAPSAPESGFRVKGIRPYLNVYRKSGENAEHLENGSSVRKGDLIQISYVAGEAKFGVILSQDGEGQVSWHLPSSPGQSAALKPGAEVVLPDAFELDGSKGFEKFVFLVSDHVFSPEQALALLEKQSSDESGSIRKITLALKK